MTNKEAIEELKPLTKYSIDKNGVVGTFPMVWRPGQVEALNLAIKALEEVECLPENLHREREQAYMNGYADGYKRGEEEQERPTGECKCVTCKYCDGEIINKPCRTCSHAWADLYEEAENDKID